MKKILLGFMAVAISFAAIAQSETGKHKGHRKGEGKEFRHKGARGFEALNLTDAQKVQIKAINEKFRTQVQSLSTDKSLSVDAQKEKRQALRQEHKSQLMAILSPEQKKQWEEKRKQHGFKGRGGKKFDKGIKQST